MNCRIDHTAEDALPIFLCRTCTPRATMPVIEEVETPSESIKAIPKTRLRRLRAEERRLSDLIDDIGGRDPARTKKLYAAIKSVEDEIVKVTHGL